MAAKSILTSFSSIAESQLFGSETHGRLENELQGCGYNNLILDSLCSHVKREMSAYSQDPLSGLYKSASGLLYSRVGDRIHRKKSLL